jgi:hypothetical protein
MKLLTVVTTLGAINALHSCVSVVLNNIVTTIRITVAIFFACYETFTDATTYITLILVITVICWQSGTVFAFIKKAIVSCAFGVINTSLFFTNRIAVAISAIASPSQVVILTKSVIIADHFLTDARTITHCAFWTAFIRKCCARNTYILKEDRAKNAQITSTITGSTVNKRLELAKPISTAFCGHVNGVTIIIIGAREIFEIIAVSSFVIARLSILAGVIIPFSFIAWRPSC